MPADLPDLSERQRQKVFERDRNRCLRCGQRPVTLQHRRAKGMGGLGLKATRLTPADCVALCGPCNARAESDLQGEALRYGWKVKNFSPVPCTDIPYYDKLSGNWWLADKYGDRRWADPQWSVEQVAHALGA